MKPETKILFVLTGSIAAYKACEAISRLVQRGHRVRSVATSAALRFVGSATLEGLTGAPVLTDLFAPRAALEHINLVRWADVVIVCPATANTLNRFAAGLADDLVGALFLAHDRTKPFLIAPAMNPAMWSHPATVASVSKLREWGIRLLPAGEGRTACGETGEGRLIEPDALVAAVEAALLPPSRRLRVLITSGGTAELLDGVRVLTNTSSGRTGAGLADHFARRGHDVVLLRARGAVPAASGCTEETFFSFADLDAALTSRLGGQDFDAVIHAAAVGDFGIEEIISDGKVHVPGGGKLDSASPPQLRLRSHPKLVDALRTRSRNQAIAIVAFKLTRDAGLAEIDAAIEELFARAGVDFVVHNDLAQRSGNDDFPATIHDRFGATPTRCATRTELFAQLEQILVSSDQVRLNSNVSNPCFSVST